MRNDLVLILLFAVVFGLMVLTYALTPGTPLNLLLYTPTPGK